MHFFTAFLKLMPFDIQKNGFFFKYNGLVISDVHLSSLPIKLSKVNIFCRTKKVEF